MRLLCICKHLSNYNSIEENYLTKKTCKTFKLFKVIIYIYRYIFCKRKI